MRKIFATGAGLLLFVPVMGQSATRSAASATRSIHVSQATEAPSSNIDLLKQAFQSSTQPIAGVASSTATKPKPKPVANNAPVANKSDSSVTPKTASTTTVQQAVQATPSEVAATSATPTEQSIEKDNALLPPTASNVSVATEVTEPSPIPTAVSTPEEAAADAELELAVKMLEEAKEKAANAPRRIQPSVAEHLPQKTAPAPNKKFDPNDYRPGVTWVLSKSTHFDIYTQKRTSGVPSANISMAFETAYQTLRRFIPWMMSGRVRVFVYQDYQSYLRYEPDPIAWSRARAYPTRGEIVVYDEPGKSQELKEVFTHELTHIFTQQFFDKHKTGRLMTPVWLDEGLAVMMEDQAYNGRNGGPWAHDFNTLDFRRDPTTQVASFSSTSMFGGSSFGKPLDKKKRKGPTIYFTPFAAFMEEDSLDKVGGKKQVQDWYFQAYAMVRFLLNPAGGISPSNRMQFEQFTRLLSQGEPVRDPSTGFLKKDARGKTIYKPYSVEAALGRVYRYNTIANFEDNFWKWANR